MPLRTDSPTARSTSSGSPVSADSSSTAGPAATSPSTGSTSPGPTTTRSPTATSSTATSETRSPTRLRAVRGARSSNARRSRVARRCAAASNARPVANITAINAPARYSRTASVPSRARTAIRSTPRVRRSTAATTQPTAGTTATTVAAAHTASAHPLDPATHATPPATSKATVVTSSAGSNHRRAPDIATDIAPGPRTRPDEASPLDTGLSSVAIGPAPTVNHTIPTTDLIRHGRATSHHLPMVPLIADRGPCQSTTPVGVRSPRSPPRA